MKKLLLTSIAAMCFLLTATVTNAGTDQPLVCTVNASVGSLFSMEWEDDSEYVNFPDGGSLSFTNVDVTSSLNYLDGHDEAKSDIALICKSNETQTWGLKTSVSGSSLEGSLLYYMDQPTVYDSDVDKGVATDGTLGNPAPQAGKPWPVIPQNNLVYTSGSDTVNTPFGTYCGLSIGLDGGGVSPGNHVSIITFTMTQNT